MTSVKTPGKVKNKMLRTCRNGHQYYKSSQCPVCPKCEAERKPVGNFLSLLSAPARRALEENGITTIVELSKYSEDVLLSFHGIGKTSIPKLKKALRESGLEFRK